MGHMSARRALLNALRSSRPTTGRDEPPQFWGRVGPYEAVTRHGVLFLLAPEPAHPSLRVTNRA